MMVFQERSNLVGNSDQLLHLNLTILWKLKKKFGAIDIRGKIKTAVHTKHAPKSVFKTSASLTGSTPL